MRRIPSVELPSLVVALVAVLAALLARWALWPVYLHRAAKKSPALASARGRQRKVSIIEDGLDTAESFRLLLTLLDIEVKVPHDGASGVEQARIFAPDAVVCDLGLPGMNGFEVARQLRAETGQGTLLLICVSGYGQEEDRKQAREAGFDEMLVKPVDPGVLVETLLRLRK